MNFDPLLFGKGASAEAEARKTLDGVWGKLSQGGKALMPLDKYPFSERYGWVQDKYGLTWQLMLTGPEGDPRPAIIPSLMFTGGKCAVADEFDFNEAVSLMVVCDTQEEIDYYWEKLSAAPEAEQCGWLKDEFGVSWQVVPASLDEMLREGSPEQVAGVTQAFLQMKKFDLAALKEAYEGAPAR